MGQNYAGIRTVCFADDSDGDDDDDDDDRQSELTDAPKNVVMS